MSGVIALVLIFKASSNLAAAYGIAVSATMLITTMLILVVARTQWKIPLPVVAGAGILMFFVDGLFFSSNILKIQSGGWLVLCIASAIYLFMKTWLDGREILKKSVVLNALDIAVFAQEIATTIPLKIPGTAVFLGGNPQGVPRALLHNIKHNKVLHEHTIILSVQTEDVPTIPEEERVIIDSMGNGIYRLSARFGFSETPDIPRMLAAIHFPDLQFDPMKTTFFLGRELIVASPAHTMQRWRKILFMFMSHNALNATNFFKLPANRVVELGSQITL
jgi:KUP system potassium uptake protein